MFMFLESKPIIRPAGSDRVTSTRRNRSRPDCSQTAAPERIDCSSQFLVAGFHDSHGQVPFVLFAIWFHLYKTYFSSISKTS